MTSGLISPVGERASAGGRALQRRAGGRAPPGRPGAISPARADELLE